MSMVCSAFLKKEKAEDRGYGRPEKAGEGKNRTMTELEDEKTRRVEAVRDFLCGYQLCLDMLNLRQYERKRAKRFEEPCCCEDVLAGDEAYWQARMLEIGRFISAMKNGREKLLLYYHYIRGESVERAANLLGVSRRTGYRILERGLFSASFLYKRWRDAGML